MTALRWVPVALVAVAEAAWIAVLAGFAQELVLRDPTIGLAQLLVFVVVGVAAARFAGTRLGDRWPPVALGLALLASLAGLALDPAARAAMSPGAAGGGLAAAVGLNPGGLFAGLALLRGYGHSSVPLGEDRLARLLFGGMVVISLLGFIGGLIAEPYRSRFETDAMTATLVFAGGTVLALALTRLTVVGAAHGADWPRNPVWLGLLVAIVATALLVAAPAIGLVRPTMEIAVAILMGPVLIAGLLFGWTRGTALALAVVVALAVLLPVLIPGGRAQTQSPGQVSTGNPSTPAVPDPAVTTISGLLLVIAATVVLLLLIRAWMRRTNLQRDSVLDTRTIDHGADGANRPRRPRRVLNVTPTDAAAAYRSLLADLAGRPIVARAAGETPREHARRLRGDGWGRLGLELLVADYTLERFAGAGLSPAEHRRAVSRWRRLRADLKPAVAALPDKPGPAGSNGGPRVGGNAEDLPPAPGT